MILYKSAENVALSSTRRYIEADSNHKNLCVITIIQKNEGLLGKLCIIQDLGLSSCESTDNLIKIRDELREKKKTYRDNYSSHRREVKINKKQGGKGKGKGLTPQKTTKRRCGLYRVEGHYRRRCPDNKENETTNRKSSRKSQSKKTDVPTNLIGHPDSIRDISLNLLDSEVAKKDKHPTSEKTKPKTRPKKYRTYWKKRIPNPNGFSKSRINQGGDN